MNNFITGSSPPSASPTGSSSRSVNVPLVQIDSPNSSSFMDILADIDAKLGGLSQVNNKQDQCLSEFAQMKVIVGDLKNRVDTITASHQSLVTRSAQQEQRISNLENKITTFPEDMLPPSQDISRRLDSLASANTDFELIITGIPEVPNENLQHTISCVAAAISVPFSSTEFAPFARIRAKPNMARPITMRFLSTFTRDAWLMGKKNRKDLWASDIHPS